MSPPSITVVRISAPSVDSTLQFDQAVRDQQPAARAHALRQARKRRREPARPAGEVAGGDGDPVAGLDMNRPMVDERAGANLRAAEILEDRDLTPARAAAARMRWNVAACDVCVPWAKLRRKMSAPPAMSASSIASESLAGPTVAMILV